MGTNMAIWEHRIFLPFLFIFIFVLSLNCLSTKGVVKIYILNKVCRKYADVFPKVSFNPFDDKI